MRRYIIIFHVCLLLIKATSSKAQVDPHFTQFYAFPVWLNPAMTGNINGGDARMVAIHRNQWNNVSSPFSTIGISYDWLTRKSWGFGVQAVHQTAGGGGYRNATVALSIANNNIKWGEEEEQHLSLALQIGVNNRSIEPDKFQYGDQYNPVIGYDPSIYSRAGNRIVRNALLQPDAGAGFFYYRMQTDVKWIPFGGFSVSHLNKPNDNFSDKEAVLPIRYTGHIGAIVTTESNLSIEPSLLFMKQGKSTELVAGVQGEFELNEAMRFSLGANYRVNDAINALGSITVNGTRFGFSYDINASGLRSFTKPVNSLEVSISRIVMRRNPFQEMIERCPNIKL